MKIVNLTNYIEFADSLCKQFVNLNDEYGSVSVIALYDEAKQVIAACVRYGLDIASVKIDNAEYGDYCDEYIITINQEGLWCEPFKRNDEYIFNMSNLTYVFDNCNSKVIRHCKSETIYEVYTDDSKEENVSANISLDCCCNDGCNNKCEYQLEDSEIYSASLNVNKNGNFATYSYTTSDKSSVDTILDKIRELWA